MNQVYLQKLYIQPCKYVCECVCIFSASGYPRSNVDCIQVADHLHDTCTESFNGSSLILVPEGCSFHFKSSLQANSLPGHKPLAPM